MEETLIFYSSTEWYLRVIGSTWCKLIGLFIFPSHFRLYCKLVTDIETPPLVIPFVHTWMQDLMPIGNKFPTILKNVSFFQFLLHSFGVTAFTFICCYCNQILLLRILVEIFHVVHTIATLMSKFEDLNMFISFTCLDDVSLQIFVTCLISAKLQLIVIFPRYLSWLEILFELDDLLKQNYINFASKSKLYDAIVVRVGQHMRIMKGVSPTSCS